MKALRPMTVAALGLVFWLWACEGSGGETDGLEPDATGDVAAEVAVPDGLDDVAGDTAPDVPDVPDGLEVYDEDVSGCPGDSAPMCAAACGGDYLLGQAVCEGGAWVCHEGVLMDDCPPGTCWGMPEAGEVCDDGWKCHPERTGAFALCPQVACLECDGFEGPVLQEGCLCACDGGNVTCTALPECTTTSTTTLDGVTLQFTAERCRFTLAEAAAGLTIPYQVLVGAAWEGLVPAPQDAGHCDQPGPSGLILFEKLSGADQAYCLCDTGLCMPPDDTPIGLTPGAYPGAFEWDGTNWYGPSDTMNPKGAPFPAGTYTLEVSAKGERVSPPGPFEVKASLTIILEP